MDIINSAQNMIMGRIYNAQNKNSLELKLKKNKKTIFLRN
jgi:uncharacterized protein involved in type VI secretion and phage assembly